MSEEAEGLLEELEHTRESLDALSAEHSALAEHFKESEAARGDADAVAAELREALALERRARQSDAARHSDVRCPRATSSLLRIRPRTVSPHPCGAGRRGRGA